MKVMFCNVTTRSLRIHFPFRKQHALRESSASFHELKTEHPE